MVSLKDIAKECGVSTATVSKALNGQHDIGEETKARVRETAERMGYFPNAAARALKTNRSYNVGVLFQEEAGSGLTHEYFSGVLNGIKVQVEKMGYDVTFINNSYGVLNGLKVQAEKQGYDITFINTCFENRKMSYYEHCRYRNFEGIVIVCADFASQGVLELMNSAFPVVTIDYTHYNCTAVCSNNVKGMEELLKYIYKKGHRKIAYIHGQKNSNVTRERLTSFYRTMEELHIKVNEDYIREAAYLETKGAAEQTEILLDMDDPPTCILYPDDTSLIGGKNVIMERGMHIPEDVSIAGYDGTRISQLSHPRITTIRQDTEEIGREAARRLIDAIEKPRTTLIERVVIEGTLITGQSVGELPETTSEEDEK